MSFNFIRLQIVKVKSAVKKQEDNIEDIYVFYFRVPDYGIQVSI
jgi:hypothetical protein